MPNEPPPRLAPGDMYTISSVDTFIVAFSLEASRLLRNGLLDELMPKQALIFAREWHFLANDTRDWWQSVPAGLIFRFMTELILEDGTEHRYRGHPDAWLQIPELTSIPSMPSVCQACCELSTSARTTLCSRAMSPSISGDSPMCAE